jgi:hypothetical protein
MDVGLRDIDHVTKEGGGGRWRSGGESRDEWQGPRSRRGMSASREVAVVLHLPFHAQRVSTCSSNLCQSHLQASWTQSWQTQEMRQSLLANHFSFDSEYYKHQTQAATNMPPLMLKYRPSQTSTCYCHRHQLSMADMQTCQRNLRHNCICLYVLLFCCQSDITDNQETSVCERASFSGIECLMGGSLELVVRAVIEGFCEWNPRLTTTQSDVEPRRSTMSSRLLAFKENSTT